MENKRSPSRRAKKATRKLAQDYLVYDAESCPEEFDEIVAAAAAAQIDQVGNMDQLFLHDENNANVFTSPSCCQRVAGGPVKKAALSPLPPQGKRTKGPTMRRKGKHHKHRMEMTPSPQRRGSGKKKKLNDHHHHHQRSRRAAAAAAEAMKKDDTDIATSPPSSLNFNSPLHVDAHHHHEEEEEDIFVDTSSQPPPTATPAPLKTVNFNLNDLHADPTTYQTTGTIDLDLKALQNTLIPVYSAAGVGHAVASLLTKDPDRDTNYAV